VIASPKVVAERFLIADEALGERIVGHYGIVLVL
jgi:hypothetical protein